MSSSSWKYSISELPEAFADVTPADVMDEGVAAIDYSEAFRASFGYMRAVLKSNELSERTLKITATCLQLNPANYTVWHFRRLCLDAVYDKVSLDYIQADLELAASLGGENPKNYQIWYHRRALLERLDLATFADFCTVELDYIRTVLMLDGKNYHAWSHRQWVVSTRDDAAVWTSELDLTESLIQLDVRNNSAWNHRWFVTHGGTLDITLSRAKAATEMEYALLSAALDPYNESPWRYYLAVLKEQLYSLEDAAVVTTLLTNANHNVAMLDASLHNNRDGTKILSIYLTSAMVDISEWKGDAESLQEAVALSEELAKNLDVIRQKYWTYRVRELRNAQGALYS